MKKSPLNFKLHSICGSIKRKTFSFSLLSLLAGSVFAQSLDEKPVKVGSVSDFQQQFKENSRARVTDLKTLEVGEKTLDVNVILHRIQNGNEVISGEVIGESHANYHLNFTNNSVDGTVILYSSQEAYRFFTEDNNVFAEKAEINKLVCTELGETSSTSSASSGNIPGSGSYVYNLQSYPQAPEVVFLDFDAGVVVHPWWDGGNPIDAYPMNLSEADILGIWRTVSEDFLPFKLNITTDSNIFNAAAPGHRMRVIFTPNSQASPNDGGVAYIGSFTYTNEVPCWVFNGGLNAASETASHEIGHTLGLTHDGRENPYEGYYWGHENNEWGAIMGTTFNKRVSQFSIGEYARANNHQDDLEIIATQNYFTYRDDQQGDTRAGGKQLVYDGAGIVLREENEGVIEKNTDKDVYYFSTNGGNVSFYVSPDPYFPNLDIALKLVDSWGNTVTLSNPVNDMSAYISTNLAMGTYYLIIDGTGNADPLTTGYSDYGSVGYYSIEGSIGSPYKNLIPEVSFVTPHEGDDILTGTDIVLNVNASDPENALASVEFYDGYTLLSTVTAPPYAFTYQNSVAGNHIFRAIATDGLGARTEAEVAVLVAAENQDPVVSITSPANGSTITDYNFKITADAYDNDGTIEAVKFYLDGNIIGYDTEAPFEAWWEEYSNVSHQVWAVAEDNRGGIAYSDSVTFSVFHTGITGPNCVNTGEINVFRVITDEGQLASVNWYTNGNATVTKASQSGKFVTMVVHSAVSPIIQLTALASYTTYPWSKEYKYNVVLNGCSNTASAPDVTLSVAEAENAFRIKAITVYDVSGKRIVSKTGDSLSEDEVRSGLADGMYIMHFITEHDAYSKKIIK